MVGNVYAFVIKDPAVRTQERCLRCARVLFPCLDLTRSTNPNSVRRVLAVPGFVIARNRLPAGARILSIQKEPPTSVRMLVEGMFLE